MGMDAHALSQWLKFKKFKRAIAVKMAAQAGARGTHAWPLTVSERLENYYNQGNRLTPRQRRRVTKKFNQARGRLG